MRRQPPEAPGQTARIHAGTFVLCSHCPRLVKGAVFVSVATADKLRKRFQIGAFSRGFALVGFDLRNSRIVSCRLRTQSPIRLSALCMTIE